MFPFNAQHLPYVKSAGGSILFTAIEKKDWTLLCSRHPFKNEEFLNKWLPGIVSYISVRANTLILPMTNPLTKPVDVQKFSQMVLYDLWRYIQLGEGNVVLYYMYVIVVICII